MTGEMETCKIFVGALPIESSEEEVVQLLKSLWKDVTIVSMYMSQSKQIPDSSVPQTAMAFVTVQSEDQSDILIKKFKCICKGEREKFPNRLIASSKVFVTHCYDTRKKKMNNAMGDISQEISEILSKEDAETLGSMCLQKTKSDIASSKLKSEISKSEKMLQKTDSSNLFVSELELLSLEKNVAEMTEELNKRKSNLNKAKEELTEVKDAYESISK